MLDSGVIGAPSWARISFRTGYDIYTGQPYFYGEERFVILDLGVHVVDVARYSSRRGRARRPARRSGAIRRSRPRIRRRCCCRHTSGAVVDRRVHLRDEEAARSLSRRRWSRSKARAARSSPKPGYRMEVTVDGKMTASEFDIPMLHWAKKPWHMIEESVLQDLRAFPRGAQGRPRGATLGPRQPQDLRDLRGGL